MNALVSLHNSIFSNVERASGWLLPSLARFAIVAVLFGYYWNSGLTKLGARRHRLFWSRHRPPCARPRPRR